MGGKILVAMSGGVDSTVAAALLLEQGFDCTGVTLKLSDNDNADSDSDLNDAQQAAHHLGIPHTVLDLSGTFRELVINSFVDSYEQGLTPNPCVTCNRRVKFGLLLERAAELGFDLLATGHYAQTERSGGRWLLKKAIDPKKDQSYVLYGLTQDTLARVRFPLGSLSKGEVRKIAAGLRLPGADKKESQDICFVKGRDYGAFMEAYTGKRYAPGNILDPSGKIIGTHRGLVRYTLGQRRGLGVAANEPVYVSAKDTAANTVTLGPESSLYAKTLKADTINLVACESLEKPMRVTVKTRYLQEEKPAWARQTGPDEISVDFDEAQRALTPGQSAVLYDNHTVVGGGIIRLVSS